MAPKVPGTGDAEGGSRDPRACHYVPKVRARFPSPEAVGDAADAFPGPLADRTAAEFKVSPGLLTLHVPVGPSGRSGGGIRVAISSWSRRSRSAMSRRFRNDRLLAVGRADIDGVGGSDAHPHIPGSLA